MTDQGLSRSPARAGGTIAPSLGVTVEGSDGATAQRRQLPTVRPVNDRRPHGAHPHVPRAPTRGSSSAAAGRELLEQAGALGEGAPDELISGRAIGQLVQGKPVGAGDDGSYRADIASP